MTFIRKTISKVNWKYPDFDWFRWSAQISVSFDNGITWNLWRAEVCDSREEAEGYADEMIETWKENSYEGVYER